jgi:hypothetical protein
MAPRLALLTVILLLQGCGLKPAAYPVPTSDMPDRPGLFSGETGELVLFRR